MSIAMKAKIKEHMMENKQTKNNQNGFTVKGRVKNNLMILNAFIDMSFKERKCRSATLSQIVPIFAFLLPNK